MVLGWSVCKTIPRTRLAADVPGTRSIYDAPLQRHHRSRPQSSADRIAATFLARPAQASNSLGRGLCRGVQTGRQLNAKVNHRILDPVRAEVERAEHAQFI